MNFDTFKLLDIASEEACALIWNVTVDDKLFMVKIILHLKCDPKIKKTNNQLLPIMEEILYIFIPSHAAYCTHTVHYSTYKAHTRAVHSILYPLYMAPRGT